jgi:F-type H+-transporting ATPase subunit b
MLDLDPGMMIWTWITFFIVLAILSKIALKPILSAIQARDDEIKNNLEDAEKQRKESEALLEQHRKLIAEAESQAQSIIKENQALAEKKKQEIIDQARAEYEKQLQKAQEDIKHEKEKALESLRAEVADLAIGAAQKIIVQDLDDPKHHKVVDEYIKSLNQSLDN